MIPTQRTFRDIETGEYFRLYEHPERHTFKLISDGSKKFAPGTEVNGFYICAHCGVDIKINSQKIVNLDMGSFYNLKEGEKITHKKFFMQKRFSKV